MQYTFKLWSPACPIWHLVPNPKVNTHPFLGGYLHEFWGAYSHPLFFFIVDPLLFKSPHMGSVVLNSESRDKEVQHRSISVYLKSNINSDASFQMLHFFMVIRFVMF